MFTKLRYVQQIQLNAGTAVPSTHVFSANGCYDPDISGVGHQPYGFDELMGLYDHYEVISSKININAALTAGANSSSIVGVYVDDNQTPSTGTELLQENPECSWGVLNLSGGNALKLWKKCNISRYAGRKRGDSVLAGNVTSNPTEDVNYIVWTGASNLTTDPAAVDIIVTIEYWVRFFEPKNISGS